MNLSRIQDYPENWIMAVTQILERLDFLREAKEKKLNLLFEDIEHQEKMLNKHLSSLVNEVSLSHVHFKCSIDQTSVIEKIKEVEEVSEDVEPTPEFFPTASHKLEKKQIPFEFRRAKSNIINDVPYGKNSVRYKMSISDRLKVLVWHKDNGVVVPLNQLIDPTNAGTTRGIGRRVSFLFKLRNGYDPEKKMNMFNTHDTTVYLYDVDEFNNWIDAFLCGVIFKDGMYRVAKSKENIALFPFSFIKDMYGDKENLFPLKDVSNFSLLVDL